MEAPVDGDDDDVNANNRDDKPTEPKSDDDVDNKEAPEVNGELTQTEEKDSAVPIESTQVEEEQEVVVEEEEPKCADRTVEPMIGVCEKDCFGICSDVL